MSVNGQATDRGMSGMSSRDRGSPKYRGDYVEGEGSNGGRTVSPKAIGVNLQQALRGHSLSSSNHPAKSVANSAAMNKSRKNQSDAHGPNTAFQGQAMPHADVKTAPGKALGKTVRQARNSYGPNIQFQGAAHQHDGVKTSGS